MDDSAVRPKEPGDRDDIARRVQALQPALDEDPKPAAGEFCL
jgi:hypothetical protein